MQGVRAGYAADDAGRGYDADARMEEQTGGNGEILARQAFISQDGRGLGGKRRCAFHRDRAGENNRVTDQRAAAGHGVARPRQAEHRTDNHRSNDGRRHLSVSRHHADPQFVAGCPKLLKQRFDVSV